jgi:hypothetical protein
MVNLLSNPKFIADTSGKSEDLAMTFAAGNSDWVDHAK